MPSVYSAGVIVKSIVKGSTIDQDGRIHIGDIILSVSNIRNTTDGCFNVEYVEYCCIVLISSLHHSGLQIIILKLTRTILGSYKFQSI